jgi:hypothetical protein
LYIHAAPVGADRFLNFEEQLSPHSPAYIVALEKLGVCIDGRERVAHIVGYRANHHANCRNTICLYQAALCAAMWPFSQIHANALVKDEDLTSV